MSKMRKRLKRILAALLAVCVVLTSFNGVAWADEGPDETVTYESKDVLFKLDAEQIKENAASAIQDGMMSGEPFDVNTLGVSSKGNAKKTYAEFFESNEGQVFEMVVPYAYDENNEENNRWMDEVPDGAAMRMFVRVSNVATASNAGMAGDEEQPEGEIEEFLFLFINNSEYNLNFKADISGRQTAVVKVPCKAAMSPKKATNSNANAPAAVGNGGIVNPVDTTKPTETTPTETTPVSSEAVSESAAVEETTTDEGLETSVTDESSTSEVVETSVSVEESTDGESSSEESVEPSSSEEATTEKAEETTEAVKESASEETTEPTTEEETSSTEKDITEAVREDKTEAAAEETEAPIVDEKEENEVVETEEPVIVSKSFNNVPMVGAGLEEDDEPQNPQEEYNMMMGRDRYDDGDEDDEDFYFDEEDTNTTEAAPAEIAGKVIAPALVAGTQTNLLSLLTFDLSDGVGEGVIAGYAADKDDVLLKEDEKTSLFKATLYDYSGTGQNNAQINTYLQKGTTIANGFKFQTGAFLESELKNEIQNAWAKEDWKKGPTHNMNIVQGITNPEYVNGHLQNRFTSIDLFPDKQPAGQEGALRVYQGVNVDKIFEKSSDGYYHFDSFENSVKYKDGALVPLEASDNPNDYKNPGNIQDGNNQPGFWPFGKNNWFFGMKLSFDFSVMEDGTYNGEDMIFKFQGDDDVWVYLMNTKDKTETGRIALDVGGNHNRMGGSINFATGEIKYYRVNNTIWNNPVVTYQRSADNKSWIDWTDKTSDEYANAYLYTLEDAMTQYHVTEKEAKARYPLGFMGFHREELAEYQLDFYYLERGGNASNCYLDFNIPVFRQDEISISKRVYSDNTEDKDKSYQFKLFTKGKNEKEFTEYGETITLKGSGKGSTKTIDEKFLEGTQYYFVEIKDGNAVATTWLSNGTTSEGANEKTSPIYTVGQQNNVVCSNYFNMNMDGTVGKKAIQNSETKDEYDIQLTVNGNTLTTDSEGEEIEEAYLTGLVVADPLSKYVDFILDENGNPQLAMSDDQASSTVLNAVRNGNIVKYTIPDSETVVAEVDVNSKYITWYVTDKDENLKKGSSKTLVYKVKTTEDAVYYADTSLYPNKGDQGTGTFSKGEGYYSNGTDSQSGAILYYNTTVNTEVQKKEFPHPVVRPLENGVLTITKVVDSEITPGENTKFTFDVELTAIKGATVVKQQPNKEFITLNVSNGIVNDTVQLGHNESVQYYGLNKEVQYTITETVFDSKEHQSALEKVEVRKNNVLVDTVEKPSSNTIVGSMNRMVDDGNEYGYVELEMDPDATSWAKATEKTDWVRDPDVLGNNGGISTSKLLDANGWWRNNTDGLLSQWDKFVKKEIGEVETPHELKKETKTYYTAEGFGEFDTISDLESAVKKKYGSLGGEYELNNEGNVIRVKGTISSNWLWNKTWYDRGYVIDKSNCFTYEEAIKTINDKAVEPPYTVTFFKKDWDRFKYKWVQIMNPSGDVKEDTKLQYSSPAITYSKNTDTHWTFNEKTYTSFNDLSAAIISAHGEKSNPQYNETSGVVTYLTFEKTEINRQMTASEIKEDGNTPVRYKSKASVLTSVNATFTNSYSEKSKPTLKLTKQVLGDSAPATAETAEHYEFVMYKKAADAGADSVFTDYTVNGVAPDKTTESFTLEAAYLGHDDSVDIIFNDSIVTGTFYLKEIKAGNAKETVWEGNEFTISSSTDKFEATCINTYWTQELTIQKTVSGLNPDENAFYHFEVQLKANGAKPLAGDVNVSILSGKVKANITDEKVYTETETMTLPISNGKIDFYLSHGGAVKLLNLPKDTSYLAREILSDNNIYYTVNLTGIKKNNIAVEDLSTPVSGTLTKENLSDAVEFINSYTMKTMSLSLTKKLVDENSELKADSEEVTFIFKITNRDSASPGAQDSFYRRLTIPAGSTEMTIVIQNLPVSTAYEIVEMDHMRYEVVGENVKVTSATDNSVVFENHKVSEGRFSSTSAVTNKVNGQFGFVQHKDMPNEELPQRADTVLMALPPNVKTSNFDSDGYDDGDTQLR